MTTPPNQAGPPTELTAPERHLIEAQGLFAGASAVAGLFLNLYLFKVGGISAIAWYQIINFTVVTVQFVVAGVLLRRRSTRTMMRVGLSILCAEYGALMVLGDGAQHAVVLLGLLEGLGQGLYWAGVNVNEYVVTHRSTRALYIGRLALWNKTIPAAAQVISGAVITGASALLDERAAYLIVFAAMIATFVATIHHVRRTRALTGVEFRLQDCRDDAHNPLWRLSLLQQALRGAWSIVLGAFTGVLLYLTLGSELRVSTFTAIATVASGIAGIVAGRALHRDPRAYALGAAVVPLGLLGFGADDGAIGLAAYAIGIGCFDPFAKNAVDGTSYDAQEHSGQDWRRTYHYFVEREVALNGGRIVGFVVVLLLLRHDAGAGAVRGCLMASAVLPPLTGLLQRRIAQIERTAATQRRTTEGRQHDNGRRPDAHEDGDANADG